MTATHPQPMRDRYAKTRPAEATPKRQHLRTKAAKIRESGIGPKNRQERHVDVSAGRGGPEDRGLTHETRF